MHTDHNALYADTPPVRLFFKAAVPGVISMVAMSLYSIIEGIFVGHFVGGDAFAAMNLALPLILINFSLSDMVGVGACVHISIALGEKDEKKASNLFSCSILLILAAAITTGAVVFLLAPHLIRAMGPEESVARLATTYLRINAVLAPTTTVVFSMDNFWRICGFVRGSMLLNLLMSFLQIVLLVLFVPIGGMGLPGAAFAINLGMCSCTVIALIPFIRGRAALRFQRPRFSLSMIKDILSCGVPTFLNNISGRLFSLVMNALLIRMGGTLAVSAYAVLMYTSDMVHPMLYGLCDSIQPAIGYNWGAKTYGRVKSLIKCVFTATAVISLAAMAVMLLLPQQLVGIFVKSGEDALIQLSAHGIMLYSIKFGVWWFAFAAQGVYSAIKKPLHAAILTIATSLIAPMAAVFALWPLGLDGLWLNQAAAYLPVGIMAYFMLRKTQKELKPHFHG